MGMTIVALLFSFLQPCQSMKTVVMDGLAEWKAPTLHHHVEDSLVPVTPELYLPLPAPPPAAGADLPAFPSPGCCPLSSPSLAPGMGTAPSPSGSGTPLISSNPAVPLPTGETDTTKFRPLPTPGGESQVVVVGVGVGVGGPSHRIQMALLMASVMISTALGLWL